MAEPGPARTLLNSLAICFACSIVVTSATLLLRPLEEARARELRARRLERLFERQPSFRAVVGDPARADVEELVVELASGAPARGVDVARFDPLREAADPATSEAIPPERDVARIGRRARRAQAWLVRRDGELQAIVLPVHGRGYASILRGTVALAGDGNTLLGLQIDEQGETPGVGDEIETPEWRSTWEGRRVRDAAGEVRIRVVREEEPAQADDAAHRVDAIAGATRSSRGVGAMVRYWLGDDGFGPFLARLRRDGLLREAR